jgi:glucose-1-phosphate adenylyltransferase
MPPARLGRTKVTVMILAGGEGQRLHPLTATRAKPGVRFGGTYRMVDFTLSNCVNSGLRRMHLLTQYASTSLSRHVRRTWGPRLSDDMDEFVDFVPPQKIFSDRWYAGTADAVFQNLFLLQEERPDHVLLLSGDHAYKMDYSLMLDYHVQREAELTISCLSVAREAARQLGVVQAEADGRVVGFVEKPAEPPGLPEDPTRSLVNMGVYIWRTDALVKLVSDDARTPSGHDFGRDLLPAMAAAGRAVHAYPFVGAGRNPSRYWRDIGTIGSYWEAHMDLVAPLPELDLYDPDWPIYTYKAPLPPVKVACAPDHPAAEIFNAVLCAGSIISSARISHSVLSPGVMVQPDAEIVESVIMDDVTVGEGARLNRVIVDEGVTIPPGYEIGFDHERDAERFVVAEPDITVVPRRAALD